MAKYRIEEKPDFTVTGIGVELKSSNTDFVGLAAEKQAAENHYFFTVNEPYNGKMMYYVGVQTSQDVPNTTRIIPFPKGTHLVVSALSESPEELRNDLTNTAFGHVLREVEDYAYVGGPNAVVEMGVTNGKYMGEIWIPVVNKP
ncbi:TPA: effector binding domain-containing protein [Enterococcus faecium]